MLNLPQATQTRYKVLASYPMKERHAYQAETAFRRRPQVSSAFQDFDVASQLEFLMQSPVNASLSPFIDLVILVESVLRSIIS